MNQQYKKQVNLLLDVIPFVAKRDCFALKGGTALNMFIWNMPRLSVDIDLVYLPVNKREYALKEIKNNRPNWELFGQDLSQFPSIKWKLSNIAYLMSNNPKKHLNMLKKLEITLR